MYPTYDMNPMAIRQMQEERLSADMAHVERHLGVRIPLGGAAVILFGAGGSPTRTSPCATI